ncbi:MAG TPA: PIN domain-containing protein [Candidatus Nanoarchaeia archaeon]|nr:PIN domain-containing protein [Candidatus Nanoarchaeia archaeon]
MINNFLALSIIAIALVAGYIALKLMRLSLHSLMLGLGGAITGLLLSALLSVPLGKLPEPFGGILPIVTTVLLTIIMIAVFTRQQEHATGLASWLKSLGASNNRPRTSTDASEILVDTSVIIDGRIADIVQTGFVPGKLLVPRFVLAELQNIADSDDSMRRSRGRRGLEMLKTIQSTQGIDIEIIDDDVPTIREVDAKLVSLAQTRGSQIMTTDYNLNRVAQIEGIKVLNINELSNAIRPVVLPGEDMLVKIVQAGKERNQGVGYLPDGTMIVVENGDKMIGQEVPTEVTRVFQTVAGKMIFATPKKSTAGASAKNGRMRNGNGRTRQPQPQAQPQSDKSPQSIEERLVQDNQD